MANAIKKISVARGYDVTRYTLQCFGGAGGQHACLVADALGMTTVFVHPLAGVLSAYGMGLADQGVMREAAIEQPLADAALPAAYAHVSMRSQTEAVDEIRRQGAGSGERARDAARARALRRHRLGVGRRLRGRQRRPRSPRASRPHTVGGIAFLMEGRGLIVEAVSVEAVAAGDAPAEPRVAAIAAAPAPVTGGGDRAHVQRGRAGGTPRSSCARRCAPAISVDGPAIIAEKNATTVVEPGWQARVTELDHLVLQAHRAARRSAWPSAPAVDPVMLEVFNNAVHEHRRADGPAAAEQPRTRSTSRSASTSRARCSTPTATSSPTRRTCRCTWAR